MKCQVLFPRKNNIISLSSAEAAHSMVSVNTMEPLYKMIHYKPVSIIRQFYRMIHYKTVSRKN